MMGVRHRSALAAALAAAFAAGCAKFSGEEGPDAGGLLEGGSDGGTVVDAGMDGDAPLGPYALEVLADEPLLYWRLGEATGPFADLGKHGYAATAMRAVKRGEPSLVGDDNPSVRLTAGDSVESASPDTPELRFGGNAPFTIECWVKIDALASPQDLVIRGNSSVGIGLYVQQSGQVTVHRGRMGQVMTHGGPSVKLGKVHHLAATFDGTALRVYVDGSNGGPNDLTKTQILLTDDTQYGVTVGRVSGSPPLTTAWIDEVAIYGTALSSERIGAHARFGR